MMQKNIDKNEPIVVAVSGGKDSVATLLTLAKRGLNLVPVNFDGGWEWPFIQTVLRQVEEVTGYKIVTVRPEFDYTWLATAKPVKKKNGDTQFGYGWPTDRSRWCTTYKSDAMRRWLNANYPGAITAIGIAADEAEARPVDMPGKIYPLVDEGITQADALQLCYDAGIDFEGHYNIWDRLSCFCCPLQGVKNLRRLRNLRPDLWARIQEIGDKITSYTSMREGATAQDLDRRFKIEDRIARIEADRQVLEGEIFLLKKEIKGLKSAL
jgi:hypothetical protein